MADLVGYWWSDKVEVPITKENEIYYRGDKECPREILQYAMTNPWDKMRTVLEEIEGRKVCSYLSIMYDFVYCKIIGTGNTSEEAITNMTENILDLFNGYNKEKVEEFLDAAEVKL